MSQKFDLSPHYGFIAVLVASVLWGTTGTAASFAPHLSPLAIGALAMGGGGLLQALLARKKIAKYLQDIPKNKGILLLGALSVAIYPLAFYSSMHLAGITIGTVVSIGTAPLFTALLERICDQKQLSKRWFLSCFLGILGVLLLSLGESHATTQLQHSTDQKIVGVILGLVAVLTYSLYSWAAKKLIDRGVEAKASIGLIFGFGAALLLPTAFYTGANLFDQAIHVYVVGYMMLIPMFLGYLLFGYGLKTVPASRAVTLTLFEPFMAAVFAMLIVGEKLDGFGWLGMGLIFVCLMILFKEEPATEPNHTIVST